MDDQSALNLPTLIRNTPLERIEESQMPPATDASVRALLCTCFPAEAGVFSKTRHWRSAPAYVVLLAHNGRVQGHIAIVVRVIRCDGREVTVAGVQGFAVHPDLRGCGVGSRLMASATVEAKRRGLDFGLLFCLPALEKYYCSLGWSALHQPVLMTDENGGPVPATGKNICMFQPLGAASFPEGTIDLQGRDW